MTYEICGDNRFEIIEKAKRSLIESTNIETSEDEMKVIDSFLFRCWQMGWLGKYDNEEPPTIPCFTLSADRPHGEWYQIKDHKIMGEGYLWHCSICDYKVYQDSSKDYPAENFCPNCGAIMVKGGDAE